MSFAERTESGNSYNALAEAVLSKSFDDVLYLCQTGGM